MSTCLASLNTHCVTLKTISVQPEHLSLNTSCEAFLTLFAQPTHLYPEDVLTNNMDNYHIVCTWQWHHPKHASVLNCQLKNILNSSDQCYFVLFITRKTKYTTKLFCQLSRGSSDLRKEEGVMVP